MLGHQKKKGAKIKGDWTRTGTLPEKGTVAVEGGLVER